MKKLLILLILLVSMTVQSQTVFVIRQDTTKFVAKGNNTRLYQVADTFYFDTYADFFGMLKPLKVPEIYVNDSTIKQYITKYASIPDTIDVNEVIVRDTAIVQLIKHHAPTTSPAGPAGLDHEIQFNNTGAFGSDANFKWDGYALKIKQGTAGSSVIVGDHTASLSTGGFNTFIGINAGEANTTATYNTYIGANAGITGTTNQYNTLIGASAGQLATASNMVSVGRRAGYSSTAGNQVFIGYMAGYSNTSGASNTFIGYRSGYSNLIGVNNTFLGFEAGYTTTGDNNTFIGTRAGYTTGNSSGCVFLGANAGYYETNSNKLFIDNQARTNEATARTNALIYGVFDATPANQTLTVNAKFYKIGTFAAINVAGASAAQTIPTGTTYTKLTCYTTNGEVSNCTADAANDKITITKTGRYRVMATSSSYVNTSSSFEFTIFLGGVEQTQTHSWRQFVNANDMGGGVMQGIINVTSVPVDADCRARHADGGSVDLTITHSNFNVEYLGE